MTVYDSSVIIAYLAGDTTAVEYISTHSNEDARVVPIVLFEVYQGEVFKKEPADFAAVDDALSWVTVIESTREMARAAGELQDGLRAGGTPLSARDAFIAGAAYALDERLVVADSDFDVPGIDDYLTVSYL